MSRQNRKENLTLSNIRPPLDMAKYNPAKAWVKRETIFISIAMLLPFALIVFLFYLVSNRSWLFFLIPLPALLFYFGNVLGEYRLLRRYIKDVEKERARPLRIVEGVVFKHGRKTEDIQYKFFHSPFENSMRTVISFGMEFEDEFGKIYSWNFRSRSHYHWSKLWNMSSDTLLTLAVPGDTFYLVLYEDDGSIHSAYNQKHFVLAEEGTPPAPEKTWRDSILE